MLRLLAAAVVVLGCDVIFVEHVLAASDVVEQIDRSIGKEPAYQSEPKYCLMALGDRGDVTVWLVEDGRRLYVDKNANRDLTDDGPPLEPSNLRHLDSERWDFEYLLDAITPADGSRHTEFVLNRWSYEKGEENYGLLLSVNGEMPMYAGWFGTFWGPTPEKAPVIHFGGPFAPKGAVIGDAKVMIELPKEAEFITLTTTEIAAPVVKPK